MLKKIVEYFRALPKKQRKSILTRLCSVVVSGFKKFRPTNEFFEALASVFVFLSAVVIFAIVIYIGGFLC